MCTLRVDFIYLFGEKKRQKIPYYLQGPKAVPRSRSSRKEPFPQEMTGDAAGPRPLRR